MSAQSYRAHKITTPIVVDGNLDERSWEVGDWTALNENSSGSQPDSEGTFAIVWDDQFLYLGYRFSDSNILSTIDTRDARVWIQDVAEIFFSPVETERIYYEFQFNPRNNWRDVVILHNKNTGKIQPLAAWDSKATVRANVHGTLENNQDTDKGWTLEVSIPFEDIWLAPNTPPLPGDRWRMNVFRIDYGLEAPELTAWNPTRGASFHVPAKFGTLVFTESQDN